MSDQNFDFRRKFVFLSDYLWVKDLTGARKNKNFRQKSKFWSEIWISNFSQNPKNDSLIETRNLGHKFRHIETFVNQFKARNFGQKIVIFIIKKNLFTFLKNIFSVNHANCDTSNVSTSSNWSCARKRKNHGSSPSAQKMPNPSLILTSEN